VSHTLRILGHFFAGRGGRTAPTLSLVGLPVALLFAIQPPDL
jgi:hypothetical protein